LRKLGKKYSKKNYKILKIKLPVTHENLDSSNNTTAHRKSEQRLMQIRHTFIQRQHSLITGTDNAQHVLILCLLKSNVITTSSATVTTGAIRCYAVKNAWSQLWIASCEVWF